MRTNTKDQATRREKTRAARERWLKIRSRELQEALDKLDDMDAKMATLSILADIAQSLRAISYGHVLDGRAKAARDKRKNFNTNNRNKRIYE